MLRSTSFFILSVSLHAAALVYPLSFGGRGQAEPIRVTILPLEQDAGGAGAPGRNGNSTALRAGKSRRSTPSAVEPRVEAKPPAIPEAEVLRADNVATANESAIALVSAIANSADTFGAVIPGRLDNDANSSGNGPAGGTASGNRFAAPDAGSGLGSGTARGSSGNGVALFPAQYRDTPRPEYPESARRDGREGRVLLRVLVDDQGRSRQVEINSSSGNEALDRAAAEAMRRWRFHPARQGDKPVESWLRVPIEFRLADVKP
jgi:TonB family protein